MIPPFKTKYSPLEWAEWYYESAKFNKPYEKNMWLYLFIAAEIGEI